jgi:hypothetical protein
MNVEVTVSRVQSSVVAAFVSIATAAGYGATDRPSPPKPAQHVAKPAPRPLSRHHLKISVTEAKLWLYDGDKVEGVYRVATGRPDAASPDGEGRITAITFKPDWYPTAATRAYYKEKKNIDLPERVPFGHPKHMLGAFKMKLTHITPESASPVYAIHGSPGDAGIGRRVSGGCVRMKHEEGEALAHFLADEMAAGQDIAVTFVKQPPPVPAGAGQPVLAAKVLPGSKATDEEAGKVSPPIGATQAASVPAAPTTPSPERGADANATGPAPAMTAPKPPQPALEAKTPPNAPAGPT